MHIWIIMCFFIHYNSLCCIFVTQLYPIKVLFLNLVQIDQNNTKHCNYLFFSQNVSY